MASFSQHLFASEHRDEIIRSAIEHAGNFIGITLRLRKEALTFESFVTDRLGKYSSDESITSLAEFVVQKITPRHPVRALWLSLFLLLLCGSQSVIQGSVETPLTDCQEICSTNMQESNENVFKPGASVDPKKSWIIQILVYMWTLIFRKISFSAIF